MAEFRYPIRVLKRKLEIGGEPFIFDSFTGRKINTDESKKPSTSQVIIFLSKILLLIVALGTLYFTVASPVFKTLVAKKEVTTSIQTLGVGDVALVKKIKFENEVINETSDSGIVNITIKVNRKNLQNTLADALALNSVKEVYTDGNTMSITFVSSDQ